MCAIDVGDVKSDYFICLLNWNLVFGMARSNHGFGGWDLLGGSVVIDIYPHI